MIKKRNFVTVVFSNKVADITAATSIMMVVTGDKNIFYYDDYNYAGTMFIQTRCRAIRYWIAKLFLKRYVPGLCGFNCPVNI